MGSIGNRFNIKRGTAARCGRLSSLSAFCLRGCAVSEDQRGNLPDPDKLAEVKPGTTTKEQVVKILGSPSSASTFDDDTWYYISRKTKQVAFFSPDVLDQQVYIVDFDDKGVVKDLGHKTLAERREHQPGARRDAVAGARAVVHGAAARQYRPVRRRSSAPATASIGRCAAQRRLSAPSRRGWRAAAARRYW